MPTFSQSLLVLAGGLVFYAAWKLINLLIRPWTSPLRYLPGPPSSSWLKGNMKDFDTWEKRVILSREWPEKYGPTMRIKAPLLVDRLWTIDPRALNHILTHSMDYPKPEMTRAALSNLFGEGLLFAEGDHHRRQRRVMNPAFGPAQVRDLTDIFWRKAIELRDVWGAQAASQPESARVDVFNGLNKMTLDVIGLAGFNYDFDSLNPNHAPDELYSVFRTIFDNRPQFTLYNIITSRLPALRLIFPSKFFKRATYARQLMHRIGMKILDEKRAEISKKSGVLERKDVQGRDLLTLLIKANMATDLPESQKLSDEDVVDQVPTFLVAGHETTSTATSWALFALTQAQEVQKKLREELLSVPTETPSVEELSALPYLDAVVRETLRCYAPVEVTLREARKDDVIPLSTPVKDKNGVVHESVKIQKGTIIQIPIRAINTSRALWGDDAEEFRPERWFSVPEVVQSIPGVWGNMLTFLGGPRSCIGYRFALIEMKVLLFTLLRAFEYELAVPVEDVTRVFILVTRPLVKSEREKGNQLPLLIKPYEAN